MAFSRISLLGLPLDVGVKASDILSMFAEGDQPRLVDFVGPEAWSLAKRQPGYSQRLGQMSLIVPDGFGIAISCFFLARKTCSSYSFDMTSVARLFFKMAGTQQIPIALVGGRPGDDEDARPKLMDKFPGLKIVATAHGYGDFQSKIGDILAQNPKAIVVSMISPRREEFLVALRDAGFKGLVIGCSNFVESFATEALDYLDYATWFEEPYVAPFYKIYKEPRRLWRRYGVVYKDFAVLSCRELVRQLTSRGERIIQHVSQK